MRLKKFLTFMLALAFTGAMGGGLTACMGGGSSESDSPVESSEEVSSPADSSSEEDSSSGGNTGPVRGEVLDLNSIPSSALQVSAEATDVATSYWSVEYAGNSLRATVYVKDGTIYDTAGNIYGNDYVELRVAKASNANGYTADAISVVVDATGSVYATKLDTTEEVTGVTANVKLFNLPEGEDVDGWKAVIDVPYTATILDSASDTNALICVGMCNVDSRFASQEEYCTSFEDIEVNPASVRTWLWMSASNTYQRNPNYYTEIDGVKIDGVRDEAYGDFTDTVLMDDDRSYSISAVKTANGVLIWTQATFNTSVAFGGTGGWGDLTNFEFKLNGAAESSYINVAESYSADVSEFLVDVEQNSDNKYVHTFELFVNKANIQNWTNDGTVQLNYAWKSPNETAAILDDLVHQEYAGWNPTDFHAYHRLGGLVTGWDGDSTADDHALVDNLQVSADGLAVVTAPTGTGLPTIDGNLEEYAETFITSGDATYATVNVTGKVVNGDMYLALTITHDAWSKRVSQWWFNDNLEIQLNGETTSRVIMFFDGELIITDAFDAGAAVTTTVDGRNVTTVELYLAGDSNTYEVKIGMSGNGFGHEKKNANDEVDNWQSIFWGGSGPRGSVTVTENGVKMGEPVTVEGITLDGELTDSVYTSAVKTSAINTEVNGGTLTIIGAKTANGVIIGATVVHTQPIGKQIGNANEWWAYMGPEFHFSTDRNAGVMMNAFNVLGAGTQGYAKTVDNGDGTYTTTFEMYAENSLIGATAGTELQFYVGGWYETGFLWLFGYTDQAPYTHKITANGIEALIAA